MGDSYTKSRTIEDVLVNLLKPFVRFCLRRNFRFQEILEQLKRAFVETSIELLHRDGATPNVSRLSLMTGLQRKEIKRLLAREMPRTPSVNLLTRVIGQWQNHPDWCDKPGFPRRLGAEGADSEFAQLVRSVSADVNPYTVLFTLQQSGAVIEREKKVLLQSAAYEAREDTTQGIEMLAQDIEDLIKAVEANLFDKPEIPNLHLTTFFDNVSLEDLDQIRHWLIDRGTSFQEEARQVIAKHDKDANPRLFKKAGGGRVSICVFSLVEGQNAQEETHAHE